MESGTKLGHYTISALIGKGGMGEVWRARDTKLGREVAIKTLPEEFARDADRLARFEREAKLLASLNHPNIAAIYGLEKHEGTRFLVLELVEGPTLADRIKQGAIPVEESLKLALQIAEALEAAHEKGVIHRDLKPDNIKVTPEGKAKVLDFGLAKAFAGDQSDVSLSNSPTLSMAATQAGIILGTAAYMSPEQASGLSSDKRSDIWSFGVVLFEMLTGRQLFSGETVSHILADVLKSEPDWGRLPANLHPRIRLLLERCLEKKANDRGHDIADARVDIQKVLSDPSGVLVRHVAQATAGSPSKLAWAGTMAAAILMTAIVTGLGVRALQPDAMESVARLPFTSTNDEFSPTVGPGTPDVAISPDGQSVVFTRGLNGLRLRRLNDPRGQDLSPGGVGPFFSPDGQWVAYSVPGGAIQRVSVNGGAPITLFEATTGLLRGGSWGTDDTIILAATGPEGLLRGVGTGGALEVLTTPDPQQGELDHLWPELLPGNDAVLFTVMRGNGRDVAVLDLDTGEQKVLVPGGSYPRYASTGHIVYAASASLYAVAFDLDSLEVVGNPVLLLNGIDTMTTGAANYDLSEDGSLIYVPGMGEAETRTLALVDRSGGVTPLDVRLAPYWSPRASPNGTRIAVQTLDPDGGGDIWVYDLDETSQIRQLTQEGSSIRPIWMPDGERITFASDREGTRSLYSQPADGSGVAQRLTTAAEGAVHSPESWRPDGETLSFLEAVAGNPNADVSGGNLSVWTVSPTQGGDPELLPDTPDQNRGGSMFSPDGNWIAYHSGMGGANQIYVQPFPSTGVRHQVTQDGGIWPTWSPGGEELFFERNGNLVAVAVSKDPRFSFGAERMLPIQGFFAGAQNYRNWDIMPDGERLLMVMPSDRSETAAPQINIVLNWTQELLERVPVD